MNYKLPDIDLHKVRGVLDLPAEKGQELDLLRLSRGGLKDYHAVVQVTYRNSFLIKLYFTLYSVMYILLNTVKNKIV